MPEHDGSLIISVIGTLPPLKGISPYCTDYALSLAKEARVEFINFKKLYPERLYPGGTSCDDLYPADLSHPNLNIRNILTWYNPLSWVWAGLSLKGDVVHAQWWSYALMPVFVTILAIAKLRRKKVVITVHNVYPHEGGRLKSLLNRAVFPLAELLLVHSEKNKKELIGLGCDPRKIEVIPHRFPKCNWLKSGHVGLEKKEARERLGIPGDKKVLCFFGNIREYKGLDELLLALDKVRKHLSDVCLIIAGQPWEEWGKYERIIRERRLEPNLITKAYFLPFQELALHLKASDLAVFPFKELHSTSDSVSLALAMGCDVMSTRHLDFPVNEGVYFIEDSYHELIADGILRYFEDQPHGRTDQTCAQPLDREAGPEKMLMRIYDS